MNSGVSSNMWMKPCISRSTSFGMWRVVRVSPCRKIGMSALRKRISCTKARRSAIALSAASGEENSSSSIDRMKAEPRLCCWAKELRSP